MSATRSAWGDFFGRRLQRRGRSRATRMRAEAFVDKSGFRLGGSDIPGVAQSIALAVEAVEAVADKAGRALALARMAERQLDAIERVSQA